MMMRIVGPGQMIEQVIGCMANVDIDQPCLDNCILNPDESLGDYSDGSTPDSFSLPTLRPLLDRRDPIRMCTSTSCRGGSPLTGPPESDARRSISAPSWRGNTAPQFATSSNAQWTKCSIGPRLSQVPHRVPKNVSGRPNPVTKPFPLDGRHICESVRVAAAKYGFQYNIDLATHRMGRISKKEI
jgi:hypothetical protein